MQPPHVQLTSGQLLDLFLSIGCPAVSLKAKSFVEAARPGSAEPFGGSPKGPAEQGAAASANLFKDADPGLAAAELPAQSPAEAAGPQWP